MKESNFAPSFSLKITCKKGIKHIIHLVELDTGKVDEITRKHEVESQYRKMIQSFYFNDGVICTKEDDKCPTKQVEIRFTHFSF